MDFWSAVKSVFSQYATFGGRALRSEFWYFVLFNVIVSLVLSLIDAAIFGSDLEVFSGIWGLATIVPSVAVAARRLHDIDRSGWWQLIALIPIIGWIIALIWYCRAGTDGANRFGPDPLPG
jgi:uncharacterized membrane protein YhaH (DUF805 family)